MPNFLLIGAAKSGTTSLDYYLGQHPQIYMSPIKETNFFAFEGEKPCFSGVKLNESTKSYHKNFRTNINSYRQLFHPKSDAIAIGESSPSYLYIPKAASRIAYYIPDVKLILILRDPIERAYSNFLHHVRDRVEACNSFAEAVEAEQWRIQNDWWWGFHYIHVGLYFEQLLRYSNFFSLNQIQIFLYEDLVSDAAKIVQILYQFLGVDDSFVPDLSTKLNTTGIPKNKLLDSIIKESNPLKTAYQFLLPAQLRKHITASVSQYNALTRPQLTSEFRNQLLPLFREDILRLQDFIDRDLSKWLT